MPDLTTYTWRQLAPANDPGPRFLHGMVWIDDGVFLFGGLTGPSTVLDDTWLFAAEDWTDLAPTGTPPGRYDMAIAWDGNDHILMFGGNNVTGTPLLDTWDYQISTNTWTELFPATSPANTLDFAAPKMVHDGSRFVMQGSFFYSAAWHIETWKYEAANWTQLAPGTQITTDRTGFGFAFGDGKAVLFSGATFGPIPVTEGQKLTWDFEADTWAQRVTADFPSSAATGQPDYGRYDTPIAHDNEEALLFGGHIYDVGFVGTISQQDTWMLSPTNWVELPQAAHPLGRYSHGLVWDPVLLRFLLFGGYREDLGVGTQFEDTWVFEPPSVSTQTASIRATFGLGR